MGGLFVLLASYADYEIDYAQGPAYPEFANKVLDSAILPGEANSSARKQSR